MNLPPPPPSDPIQVPSGPGALPKQVVRPTSVMVGAIISMVVSAALVIISLAAMSGVSSFGEGADGIFGAIIFLVVLFFLALAVLGVSAFIAAVRLMQGSRSARNYITVLSVLNVIGGLTTRDSGPWGLVAVLLSIVVVVAINTKDAQAYFAKR